MVGLVGDGLNHGLPHLQSHVLGLSDTRTHIDAVFGTPFFHSLPSSPFARASPLFQTVLALAVLSCTFIQ